MMKKLEKHESLRESLEHLLKEAPKDQVPLSTIFRMLAGRGYPIILIFLVLPFCLPIQIPGFSTPFGLAIAFMGIRMSFGKKLWWPKWILEKKIPYPTLEKIVHGFEKWVTKIQKYLHPRFEFMIYNPIFHRMHGVLICILGLLLALPIPLPLTNLLAALPILVIALGLLEDDGLVIVLGYVLAEFGLIGFIALFYLGKEGIQHLLQWWSFG